MNSNSFPTVDDATSNALLKRLKRQPSSPRTLFNSFMTGLVFFCAICAIVPLVAVLWYVIAQGGSRLSLDLFTQLPPAASAVTGGGFGNAFIGTLTTVGIGSAIAIPCGIMAAIFLSEFAQGTRLAEWIGFLTNVLSGVPSIVVGVFAYSVVVLMPPIVLPMPSITEAGFSFVPKEFSTGGFSAVAGGFALAVLMLPIIVRTSTEALALVPQESRQAAVGLGATRFQTVARVVLPAAMPPILTGVMLAVARASGETAPLIFTALFKNFWAQGVWEPTATLSVLVFNFATTPYKNQQELAAAGSLVLVLMVLIASILSRLVVRRK
jgi:phosphate transport system permease protein